MTTREAFTQGLVFGTVLGALLLAGIIALARRRRKKLVAEIKRVDSELDKMNARIKRIQ